MKITTVGLDLAKNVFQVHGVDERGKVVLKKQLKRQQVLGLFSNMPPCLIGMDACSGAHFWARRLQERWPRLFGQGCKWKSAGAV
jgi:transposase